MASAKRKSTRRWRGLSPIQRKVYDYIKVVESPSQIDQTALEQVRAMGTAGAQAYWTEKLEPSAREAAAVAREFLRGNPSEDEHAKSAEKFLRQADAALKKARRTKDRLAKAESLMVALRDSATAYHEALVSFHEDVIDAAARTSLEARAEMLKMLDLPAPPLGAANQPPSNPRRGRRKKNPSDGRAVLRRAMRGT